MMTLTGQFTHFTLPLYELIVDTLLSDCGMDPLPLPNQLRWFLSIILPHSFTLSIVIATSHALSFATNKNRVSLFLFMTVTTIIIIIKL